MTIHEQIARIEAQITEFMAVLPRINNQENKRVVNAHIIELSHELHELRTEQAYEASVDAFNDRV